MRGKEERKKNKNIREKIICKAKYMLDFLTSFLCIGVNIPWIICYLQ